MRRHDPPRAGAAANGAGIVGALRNGRNDANIYTFPVRSKHHLDIDLTVVGRFLAQLTPDGLVTFQTFDDRPADRPSLSRIKHGSLSQYADELIALNQAGAGIFLMVNRGDGRGRRAKNVIGIRALFVDLDGAPLQPVLSAGVPPHLVVESSHRRYHCYWISAGCPVDRFTTLQKALAARFNGDPTVHDLPRVMRLPGFLHRKSAPFRTALMLERGDIVPYRLGDLVEKLKLREFIPAPRPIAPATYTPIKCPVTDFHVYARTALERAAGAIASAPNQQQNRTLNREAFGIGQLVAGRALPERMARTMLIAAARRMPNYDEHRKWLPQQIEEIVDRAFSYALRSPRGVPK